MQCDLNGSRKYEQLLNRSLRTIGLLMMRSQQLFSWCRDNVFSFITKRKEKSSSTYLVRITGPFPKLCTGNNVDNRFRPFQ